jgi:phage gp36-like protein
MAYATVTDMINRFGATEMVRLTTPSDQEMDGVVATVAATALNSAGAIMDSYIGRRYRVPMDVSPPVVTDICCDIARFKLSTGDQKTCSEEVRVRHKDAMDWLRDVSLGKVVLELDEVATGDESYAQVSTGRDAMFGGGF